MLGKEDYILVELLGKDSPQVQALVGASQAGMNIHEMLRSLVRQRGWNPDDPPKIALPTGLSPSDYPIGTAMSGDVKGGDVGPSDDDLRGHVGVLGQTSTGKSTLVKLLLLQLTGKLGGKNTGRTFFVWDAHGEYRNLLPLFGPDELVWLDADDLGINPFEVPTGRDGQMVTSPDAWLNNLRELFRVFWLNEPSLNLLCEVLHDEYERRGLLGDNKSDWPSLSDVIEAVRRLNPPRNSDRARAKDKLLDRLTSLRAMLPGLNVQRSRNVARLLDMSVILDVSGVKDVARPALFSLLVMETAEVLGLDAEASITRAMVIDEAHEVLGGQTDKRTADLKEGRPSSLLRELRKTGTCGIVATHLPSDLAHGVRGNIGSVIALRQGNRDSIRETAAMLNLAPWQEGELAKLPAHYAIARFSRHGEPVCLEIRDARPLGLGVTPPPSRDEARERSRPVLEAIPFVKGGEHAPGIPGEGLPWTQEGSRGPGTGESLRGPAAGGGITGPAAGDKGVTDPTATEGGLHPKELRAYARICERSWELIEDRMDALGLDREGEGDARAKLEARGLIAFAGKVGAKNRLFEPTARGREFAQIKGLTIARQQKGSVVHTAVVEYTQRSLGRHSAAFRFQRTGISPTTDGVQPDLLLILPGGGRIPIQACCRNQPAYEAAALLKLHRLALLGPGDADKVDFVLAVAVNKRHREAVERALERENGGKPPDRVVLLDFDTVVDPKFEWASVFEFPL